MKQVANFFFLPLIIVFLTAGCAIQKNPVSGTTRAFGYSWSQELQLGSEADPEIVAQFGLYEDEDLSDYVVEMGETVLAESHMRRPDTESHFRETEFTFRLLDSPVINAFALPGGYIYFTRGMMAHLSNEAQFSVVMGHEIGHVAARHASQRALRQQVGNIAMIGGAVLGQEILGLPGQTLLELSSTAAQLLFLSYSRDNERESDRLGVEYAAMKGYHAAEGAALFTSLKRISELHGETIPNFVSTHPDPGEREQQIPELAEQWREQGYEQTTLNEDQYMELIDGIIFGDNPRHGFEDDGIFYHPDLEFQFNKPSGWNLLNQPSQVVLVSPGDEAISIFSIDSESETPRQSVNAVTSGGGIDVIEEGQTSGRGEFDTYAAVAEAMLEDGTPLIMHIYAVSDGDYIYRFLSYTHRDQYENYEQDFEIITESFDSVTDPSVLDIQPVRLNLFRAERSGSFESFLPETLPMDIEPIDVAIINQVELEDQIEEGRWLKMPVQ